MIRPRLPWSLTHEEHGSDFLLFCFDFDLVSLVNLHRKRHTKSPEYLSNHTDRCFADIVENCNPELSRIFLYRCSCVAVGEKRWCDLWIFSTVCSFRKKRVCFYAYVI